MTKLKEREKHYHIIIDSFFSYIKIKKPKTISGMVYSHLETTFCFLIHYIYSDIAYSNKITTSFLIYCKSEVSLGYTLGMVQKIFYRWNLCPFTKNI